MVILLSTGTLPVCSWRHADTEDEGVQLWKAHRRGQVCLCRAPAHT